MNELLANNDDFDLIGFDDPSEPSANEPAKNKEIKIEVKPSAPEETKDQSKPTEVDKDETQTVKEEPREEEKKEEPKEVDIDDVLFGDMDDDTKK